MKLAFLAFLPLSLFAQQLQPVTSVQADCGKFSTPVRVAGTVVTATVDNRQAACDGWVVTYSSNGFTPVSVLLQSAPLGAGGVAGTFVNFAGTITAGPNPATATTQAEIRATGYFPYVRVQITTTGTGYLQAEFHGFKSNPNSGAGATGGCVGTTATPCVVDGPTAAGSPPTTPPVMVGGQDGTNVQTLLLDQDGALLPSGVSQTLTDLNSNSITVPQVAGLGGFPAAQKVPNYPFWFNGTQWDRAYYCTNSVRVHLTDGTRTALVAPSGSSVVRVCQIHATTDGAAENWTITQGTGAACAAGTTTIDSYLNQVGFSTDYHPIAALRTTSANGLCIAQSGGAQNADVVVIYAQF